MNKYTALIADGIAVLLSVVGGRFLLNRFAIPPTDIPDIADQDLSQLQILDVDAFVNLLMMVALYFCFLIGVFIIRKLKQDETSSSFTPHPSSFLFGIPFALLLTVAMSEMTAFFDNIETLQQLGEVGNGYVIMFTPAILLFMSLLFLFLLRQTAEPRYTQSGTAVAGLLGCNLLLLGMAAYVVGASGRVFTGMSNGVLFILTAVTLAIMLTLPRLIYARRMNQPISLFTYAGLLLIIPLLFIFVL